MHKAAQAYSRISPATSWVREIETQAPLIDIDGNLAAGLSSVFARALKLTGK